jgi:hypothetical protein
MALPDHHYAVKPSVAAFPANHAFVMVDSADAGTGTISLRVARRPQGPWSAPLVITAPGCDHAYPQGCFGAEVHEDLSDASSVSVTYYNPAVALGASPVQHMRVPVRLRSPDGTSAELLAGSRPDPGG